VGMKAKYMTQDAGKTRNTKNEIPKVIQLAVSKKTRQQKNTK
jgi:hypothetical protein